MATFNDDLEPLHGHNYEIILEIEGDLTTDHRVWDFGDLKRRVKAIADRLDHRFMLQERSPHLEVTRTAGAWEVCFRDRRYVFPESDVVALPIENTTAERISEWVANQLLADFAGTDISTMRRITVGIEEMPGQAGWYTVDL
jgi:6-pyruvoyltetrahydropterin/6-carboxytetrahydropterin synthase